ncbi:hypothetical protein L596_029049 [Steinernema carpocapsae]|uniref:dolichyl-phosphate-mannose--protein mannosyltransferase n=1 Tax=Steinernema carpocapsae TaxID=34508 RepID=A0A4U5LTH7_STECR|nr:hypothetical protein L596_029049 [Steinernema carpocapsae]
MSFTAHRGTHFEHFYELVNQNLSSKATYFHLVNIVLHALVSLLVCKTTRQICQHFQSSPRIADYTAFLFAIHPIHAEAVANVVGRAELLMTLFGLLGLSLYLQNDSKIVFPSLCVIFSMFSKEQGVFFLLSFVAFDVLKSRYSKQRPLGSLLTKINIYYLILFALLCGTRFWINGFQCPQFSKLDNPAAFHENFYVRVVNYFYIYILNFWLLIFPKNFSFDYSMGCIPLITDLGDARILSFGAYLLFAIVFTILHRKLQDSTKLLMYYGLIFIVLLFLPATNIIPVGFVIAERVLYAPSIGYCLFISLVFYHLEKQSSSSNVSPIWLLIAPLMVSRCITRSLEWRTEKELFLADLSVCPKNAKIYYNLAKVQADDGDVSLAVENYRSALQLRPDYEQALNNMANIYQRQGENSIAIDLLQKSINANNRFATAWMNLGVNQMAMGQFNESRKSFRSALEIRPHYADAYFNLGNLYLKQGLQYQAESCWKNATLIEPSHHRAWTNLLVLMDEQGRYQLVTSLAEQALRKVTQKTASIRFQLAVCQAKLGFYSDAERNLVKVVEDNPSSALYKTNLGILYEKWNKLEKAADVYRDVRKTDPGNAFAVERLRKLQMK